MCASACSKLATTADVLLCSPSTSPRGCALLEIKNLKSGETHEIPPEGALLGREGAKADIPIRDPGVSKKHARIFEKGGVWYLQDVGSSNGTFMQGKRLTGPTVLTEGAVFGMSRHKFKVTRIGSGPRVSDDEEPLFGDDLAPPPVAPAMEPRTPPRTPAPVRPPLPQEDYPPLSPSGPDEMSYGDMGATAPPGPATNTPMAAQGSSAADDEIEAKGIGYFFIAVPKAVAYYLAAVPLLAVNPFGTVKRSIDEQPHNAMGPMELIAYALPAMAFGAVFSSWCGLIGTLVGGGGFRFGLFLPIVPLIGAIIGSVIAGFLLHPVLGWLVRVLKGSSDARSRTNYYLLFLTAYVLTSIPSGIGQLLAIANVPFLSILAPALMLVASLLMLLVAYKWIVFFNVMKPVQIVVLVLGLLGAAFAGKGVVTETINSVKRVFGGGSGSAADAEAAAAKVAELQSKLAAIATDSSLSPEEKAKKAAELTAELNAATEASRAAAEAAAAAQAATAQAAAENAAEAVKAATAEANAAANAAAANAAAAAKAAGEDAKEAAKAATETGSASSTTSAPPPLASRGKLPKAPSDFPYPQFRDRRDKMEDALNKDVTLLSRVKGTLPAYQRYHQIKHEIDQRYAAETAARPDQKVVHERLAEEELYLRAYKEVQAFWRAIESYRP